MDSTRLVLLPYLQRWDGSALEIRVLLIPRISPLEALIPGQTGPDFTTASFRFDVWTSPAETMPTSRGKLLATIPSAVLGDSTAMFKELERQLGVDNVPRPAKKPTGARVRKHLPVSYRDIVNTGSRQPALFTTDNAYRCALRHNDWPPTYKKLPDPPKITWGQVIASLLRVAPLAEAAGLVRILSVPVGDSADIANSGFIHMTLNSRSDGFGLIASNQLKRYAAKFPPLSLGAARTLFTPVLFPVSDTPTAIDYAEQFAEFEDYNDGFANLVHCSQQRLLDPLQETDDSSRPVSEHGIRLGWDDEQVTIWLNRQLDSSQPDFDSPLGVAGYRIDVRGPDGGAWESLVNTSGQLKIGTVILGDHETELSVPVQPVQHEVKQDEPLSGEFWVSMYFASWSTSSLAMRDNLKVRLAGNPEQPSDGLQATRPNIRLTYGSRYEFRVRLMDTTGGGPSPGSAALTSGINPVSGVSFRRYIKPLPLRLVNKGDVPADPNPQSPPTRLRLLRPLLQYPAIACTARYAPIAIRQIEADLLADMAAAGTEGREPGLPDPDVDRVQITVEVKSVPQDPLVTGSVYAPIYTTTRAFSSSLTDETVLQLEWIDATQVTVLAERVEDEIQGPLILPTARTLRLRISSLCKDDGSDPPLYFGAQDVRESLPIFINVRKESQEEPEIFDRSNERQLLNSYFLQPDTLSNVQGESDSTEAARFAHALGLKCNGQTLSAEAGARVIFACSASIRHTVGPDGASLTFSTLADLRRRWLNVIRLTVARDWTWDGFDNPALRVHRRERDADPTADVLIGTVVVPSSISRAAFVRDTEQMAFARTKYDIIFIDSMTPPPVPSQPSGLLKPLYTITTAFKSSSATVELVTATTRLPVTTNPDQVPKLRSTGIAMSPYELSRSAAPNYAFTTPREKCLWLEFTAPLQNANDAFFARVLRNVPDPLISPNDVDPISVLPDASPLSINPESIVHVVPSQADGTSGLEAMVLLIPSEQSDIHFALPLPAEPESASLFGFWSYEIRVGHTKSLWSTAQGRFGPGLVVNGIQHPPPNLQCKALRRTKGISVSAPHATPLFPGGLRPGTNPKTSIWFLLYVQALQIDGADSRNILISRQRGNVTRIPTGKFVPPSSTFADAWASAFFQQIDINSTLELFGLKSSSSLSMLAVETMPSSTAVKDPLGADLGKVRILRISPLTQIPGKC